MTLLDVIDLDEILTVNSTWEKKLFEPRTKVGAVSKLKKKKIKTTKIIEYDGS